MKHGFIIAVAVAGVLTGLLWARYRQSRAVQNRLESQIAAGAPSFDFAAATPVEWDRMYVFGPYTSEATVEQALGFAWPGYGRTSIKLSDSVCLVVFVRDKSVVYWYEQPRTVELGFIANQTGYGRTEATFAVDYSDPARPVLKVAHPATATAPAVNY